MNKLDRDYQALLQDVLENGVVKQDRTGTGTISVFGRQIRHKMADGFPLLTTKKVFWKGVVVELLWFLQGRTDLRYLLENQVGIWTGDAYKRYQNHFIGHEDVPNVDWFTHEILHNDGFAAKFGDLGPVYGASWRNFGGVDQIANLINDLKTNPDSRRLMVSAWNVGELDQMTLPPCHHSFQLYSNERDGKRYLSLMWNQRSVDTFLGLPFNIASYGLLLEIIAKAVNMVPDELIGNLGDVHLYSNHVEQAREQINREPYALPQLNINTEFWPTESGECGVGPLDAMAVVNGFSDEHFCRCLLEDDIQLSNYQSHPAIKAPLSN